MNTDDKCGTGIGWRFGRVAPQGWGRAPTHEFASAPLRGPIGSCVITYLRDDDLGAQRSAKGL